ncbi:uncharacterized protein JCM15063_004319 [Sporobolomyces koalae]|uniref:uncharacterized protein n=1 Tax=Sporobolomyces koalae TaxID=500713 RepID=UPI00317EA641
MVAKVLSWLLKRSEAFHPASVDPADAELYEGAGTFEEASHEMFMVVTEVNIVHLAITILTLFITFFGLFSGFIKERMYIGEAIIATCFGIAFSAYGAGIFAPRTWAEGHHTDEITLELTRIVIALSVFAVGVELPKAYVLRHWKSLAMLLGPIMLMGWMIAGALMYAIIPGLEFLPALVLAAGVTPTDPILASSVVGKGKFAQEHVPSHIRHVLQAESGCNDGAAFPFLYLALFLLLRGHHSVGESVGYWILLVLLYQILLGIIIGAVVGVVARKMLKFSKRRELIDRESMVAMYVALSLLVTGLTTLAGSDDLLAAFACGTAFAWDDWFTESIEESNFSSTIDLLANSAIFIYIGATMPFSAWNNVATTLTPWRMILLCLGILTLRRLPGMYALQWWIPDIKTRREAIFAGHFGPMGVGAIFISTLAASKLPTPQIPPADKIELLALIVVPVTYCIVLSSILVHGLTISFFTLGRRVHSRVQSFSRTLTAQSGNSRFGTTFSISGRDGANEPSWMSRVKRATRAEDIVINRDEDDEPQPQSPESLAEKGAISREGSHETESGSDTIADESGGKKKRNESEDDRDTLEDVDKDEGTAAMFGAPTDDKAGAGKQEELRNKKKERQQEEDDEAERHEVDKHESDIEETGGAEVSKEVETDEDVERGRKREAKHGRDIEEDERREMDDNPPRNILGDLGADADDSKEAKRRYKEKMAAKLKGKERQRNESGSRSRTPSPKRKPTKPAKRDPRLEARYCRGTQTWQEGRKTIIDHGDGEVEVIDPDANPEATRKAKKHPNKRVYDVPHGMIDEEKDKMRSQHGEGDHEEGAVKRVAAKMMRQGSSIGAAVLGGGGSSQDKKMSQEEKDRKKKEKLERDAWCRKERHYRDSSPGRGDKEWVEGDKVVTERADGKTTVRDLTPDEKHARAKRHLSALQGLGHSTEALEAELAKIFHLSKQRQEDSERQQRKPVASGSGISSKQKKSDSSAPSTPGITETGPERIEEEPEAEAAQTRGASRTPSRSRTPSPAPRRPSTGFALVRTDRIDPVSDEEEGDVEQQQEAHESPRALGSAGGASRPAARRQNSSAMAAVRDLFRGGNHNNPKDSTANAGSPEATSPNRGRSRVPTPEPDNDASGPSIRFAQVNRPNREGGGSGIGRPLPVVGSGLSVRRTPSKRATE